MKRLIVLLGLLGWVMNISMAQGWVTLTTNVTNTFSFILVTDTDVVVTGGSNGLILNSTNGGASWNQQNSGTTNFLKCVASQPNGNLWAVGQNGTILRRNDTDWVPQTPVTSKWLNGICFADTDRGWIVGQDGTILNTTNGGSNWTLQTSGTTKWLNSVHANDTDNVIIAGDSGCVLRTTNGGALWTLLTPKTNEWLGAACLYDKNKGWVSGSGGVLMPFTDTLGNPLTLGTTDGIMGLGFARNGDVFRGFGVGDNGTIFEWNGDTDWVPMASPTSAWLNDVEVIGFDTVANGKRATNLYAYAAGSGGTVLKYTGSFNSVSENASIPTDFKLQNYPNPFNPTTTFSFSLPQAGHVTLKLYNILWEEVGVILDERRQAGAHTVSWNATNLPSGVYIARLFNGQVIQSIRTVLIK